MSIRLNPVTATAAALRTMMRLINRSGEETVHLSDMFTNSFTGFYDGISKREAVSLLRKVLNGEKETLTNEDIELQGSLES